MQNFFKKAGRTIARALLALCAFFMVALIAIQIVLVIGINMVSTGKGSGFLSSKINEAMAGSGYSVAFDSLYYDPVRGFTVYDLALADEQGRFLTLDRFSLSASFILSPLRVLDLSARGGTLVVERIPAGAKEDEISDTGEGLKPFTTPDVFFKKIILSGISFERITLGSAIAGKPYSFSPSLKARAVLDDTLKLSFTLHPGLPDIAQDMKAPDEISFSGQVTPSTLDFLIGDLSLTAPSYAVFAGGEGNLGKDGHLDLALSAHHDDLKPVTKDALKSAKLNASVTGTPAMPAIDLSALVETAQLKERGLSDMTLSVKSENLSQDLKGTVRFETSFHEQPVTLQAILSYRNPLLTITALEGTAPDLSLSGEGIFSTETNLADATLSLSAKDLARYSKLAGIELSGALKADAKLEEADDARQSLLVSTTVENGTIDTVKIKSLSAKAGLRPLVSLWPQSADIDVKGLSVANSGFVLDDLSADIRESDKPQNYTLSLDGRGRAPAPVSLKGSVLLSGLTQPVPDARDIAMTVRLGEASARLSGYFTQGDMDMTLASDRILARDLPAPLPDGLDNLRIGLDARMQGSPAKPQTSVDATLRGIGAGSYKDASIAIAARHDGETIFATLSGKGQGIRMLKADANFPAKVSLLPFEMSLDQTAPLSGTMAANLDMAALAPLFLPPTQTLSGTMRADGTLQGTLAAPAPAATLALEDARYEDTGNGIEIRSLSAAAKIDRDALTLSSLSAADGKDGKLSGKGVLSFHGGATNINLKASSFNVPRSNLANGIIDADLTLKGAAENLLLTGRTDIREMNVLIPESFASKIPQLNIIKDERTAGPGFADRLALDILVDAHNQVFMRGWGLDAEFGGEIKIEGNAGAPLFNGTLSSRRGRYEEFGKRFTLSRANLRFQGAVPPSPYLDIEATTPAGDVTGSILLTGPVKNPSIKFASTPALPEDEVLSRILFGKDSAKISPFQAVQLAQTIQRFSGKGGGPDPLGMLRSATGLDDISVDTDESGGTNVGVGKYLTDNVYLELSKGKAENSGAATIQIEVTPSINIESEIGQDAQGGGGVFWKHDY